MHLSNNNESPIKEVEKLTHRIFSAFEKSLEFPCININFQKISQTALIGTGSSLSFTDCKCFPIHKTTNSI